MPRGRTERFRDVQPFGIDKVAAAAGEAHDVLRMENLDAEAPSGERDRLAVVAR